MRCRQIGRPILPMPTNPIVSITSSRAAAPSACSISMGENASSAMAGLPAPGASAPLMGAEMMKALAEPAERASNGRRLHYFLPHRLFLSVTFSVLYVTVYIAERKRKNARAITQDQVRADALAIDGRALCASGALLSRRQAGFGMSEIFLDGIKSIQRRTVRSVAKRSRPRRGGRLTEERQREIVALVAPLFLEHGYEQVSIDDIVERIGGSKRTLYERFGGKAGLFEIVISEYCASVQRDLFAGVDQKASLEKQLTLIGKNFLGMTMHRRTLQ